MMISQQLPLSQHAAGAHDAPLLRHHESARASRRPPTSWRLMRSQAGSTVTVTFYGKLSAYEGERSAAAIVAEFCRGPATMVWNLADMSGYETGARIAWQRALWPVRHDILGLDIVGGNPLVRIGAVTMTMMLGIETRFIDRPRGALSRSKGVDTDDGLGPRRRSSHRS
jgi:hypothetical protein